MHLDDFEPPEDVWTYRACPSYFSDHHYGVVDGDTYDLIIDGGFHLYAAPRVRSLALDTDETYGVAHDSEEYKRGKDQSDFVIKWIADAMSHAQAADDVPNHWPLLVRTERDTGARGRWLAEVYDWRGNSLAEDMVDEFGERILYDP